MVADPADYVIKVYTTRALAEVGADNTALDVDAVSTGLIAGYQDDQYYKQFETYYYRIEFNEPAIGIEIDWDDGEDNSLEKANRETKIFDFPRMYTVLEHIYTKAGRFFPLIRAISPDGFFSKWYTSSNTNNDYSALESATLSAGQNNLSIVSEDSTAGSTRRIPYFAPSIYPPVAVLKTDRKTVFSGIEDGTGVNSGYDMFPNAVYAWHSAESSTYPTSALNDTVQVKVTYQASEGGVHEETIDTNFNSTNFALRYPAEKILKVELVKMATSGSTTALAPGERVYLRIPQYGFPNDNLQSTASHGVYQVTQTLDGDADSGQLDTFSGSANSSYVICLQRGQLAAAIANDTVTSVTVDDGAIFGSGSENKKILIGPEIMQLTNVSTNTLTVTRGAYNTPAQAHADDSDVYILSSGSGGTDFGSGWLGCHLWYHKIFGDYSAASGHTQAAPIAPSGVTPKVALYGLEGGEGDGVNDFASAYGYVDMDAAVASNNGGRFKFTLQSPNNKHPFRIGSVIRINVNASGVDGNCIVTAVGGADNFTINKAWVNNNIDGADNVVSAANSFAALADGFGVNFDMNENVVASSTLHDNYNHLGYWFVPDFDQDISITNVSQGWPIQEYSNSAFRIQIDASESRTRSPNLTIEESDSAILLDASKGFDQESTLPANGTDRLNNNGIEKYINQLRYNQCPYSIYFNPWPQPRSYLDGNLAATADGQDGLATNRFYDDYKLLRLQVMDDRTGATDAGTGSFAYSLIDGFTDYSQATNASQNLFDDMDNVNLIQFTNDRGATWTDKESVNDDSNDDGTSTYPLWGKFPGFTLNHVDVRYSPKNYVLMTKENKKFDRIYISVANRFGQGQDGHESSDSPRSQGGKIRLQVLYPAKNNNTNEINWRPLEFTDNTTAGLDDTSLYVSGSIVFDAPGDWAKTNNSSITWPSNIGSNSNWTINSYGIIVGIHWEATASSTFETNSPAINYIYPYDNTYSQLIKVVDPMHVNISDITVTQSLSFVRNGKYVQIDDRFGRAELRKIGASGGRIRLGGVAFGDYSTSTTPGYTNLKRMQKYQKEGTPLFYDLKRPNGTYMRFFGKAVSLSEDVPTKRMANKWTIDLIVTNVLEYDSSGNITSDGFISLGGNIDDKSKYL